MKKVGKKMIYILSSTHAATGGTELLQQLCFQLNKNGIPAVMFYTEKYDESNVKKKFEEIYNNPYSNDIEEDAIAVVPETEFDSFQKIGERFKEVYIWWLSVDNYYGSQRIKTNLLRDTYRWLKHNRNMKLFRNSKHCVQSEYARLYLTEELGISNDSIHYLSDYINDDYLEDREIDLSKKENIILYNPKKGFEFTSKIIETMPKCTWLALVNMNNKEMVDAYTRAKLYVDFGNHPGKDRIPRETAVFGCCVITGKKGAAKNDIDILIPGKYKIDESTSTIDEVCNLINTTLSNYEDCLNDFKTYRNRILQEKKIFIEDAIELFKQYRKTD